MRLTIIIILFILLAQVQGASAHFTINFDKTLNMNQVGGNDKVIPFGMWSLCDSTPDSDEPPFQSCLTYLQLYNNVTFGMSDFNGVNATPDNPHETERNYLKQFYNSTNKFYGYGQNGHHLNTSEINEYNMFGYEGWPQELTTSAGLDSLISYYNTIKAKDTNHPIIYAGYYYKIDTRNVSLGSDIFADDAYSRRTSWESCGAALVNYFQYPCGTYVYHMDDYIYIRERYLYNYLNLDSGKRSLSQVPKPFYHVFGIYNETYHWDNVTYWWNPSAEQLRTQLYWSLTAGYKGFIGWGNILKYGSWSNNGTANNLTVVNYTNRVAGDLTNSEIQSIITLPILNSSWNYATSWDNKVTFSSNPTKYIPAPFYYTGYQLTYSYYKNTTTGKDYLIVVNKKNTSIDTTITVAGISGTTYATTKGMWYGSSAAGVSHTMTNGVFTDTFDAFSAHVYEITSSIDNFIPPVLSSCSAVNTSSSVNVSCTGGSGNVTNSIRVYNVNTSTWNNVSTMYALNSGLNSGTAYTFRAYPYNNSGTGEINNTYTTVLGTTTQAESAAAFTIKGSGGNATWSSFTQNNVTEDLGSHGIKVGIFADNFEDINHNWITRSGTPTVTASSGYLILEKLLSENVWISPASNNNTTNLNLAFSVQFKDGLNREIRYFNRYLNSSNLHYSSLKDSSFRFWNVINGASTILNAQDTITPSQDIWYNIRSRFIGNAETVWVNNVEKYSYTDNNLTQNPWGFGLYNGTSWIDNVRSWNTQSGNFTSWYDAGANVTYQVVVNATTPTNTNYSVLYRQNATGDYVSLASAQTGNTTHAITTKYQNTDVRVVLNGNETETPELIAVTYYAQAPVTYAPNITSWSNTKTNNNTANFTSNVSESVTFNATANQTITTWNWYVNGTNQNINYDNISLSYSTAGTRLIQVNATNSNGTSNTISWNMTVLTPSTKRTYGIGGEFFQNKTIGSNKTCINQGDGAIGVGLLCDNFNDNNTDGWNETGYDSTWTPVNGVVNQSTATTSYLYRNVTSYENMSMFTKFKEYGSLLSYIDVVDLRGNLSRIDPTYGIPAYMTTQFSMGAINQTRAYIYSYDGYDWRPVNTTIEKTRYLGDWNYVYFAGYGTTFKGYHSNVSHSNALASVLVSGTNNTWLNGTTIQFGGRPESGTIISWDEIRAVELDALGNQYLQGNYSMNYTVPASQYAKNITINGTYASGTNYSLQYRQNATGDYIAVEGIKTANSTIELPTPYYQNIDMILEMNSTESDTLWIQNISVGASETDGSITDYTKAIIGWWD